MAGNWNEDDLFGAGGGESVPDSVPDVVPVPVIPGPLPVEPGGADAHLQDLGSVEPDFVEPDLAGPDFAEPGSVEPGSAVPGSVEPGSAEPDFEEPVFSGRAPRQMFQALRLSAIFR